MGPLGRAWAARGHELFTKCVRFHVHRLSRCRWHPAALWGVVSRTEHRWAARRNRELSHCGLGGVAAGRLGCAGDARGVQALHERVRFHIDRRSFSTMTASLHACLIWVVGGSQVEIASSRGVGWSGVAVGRVGGAWHAAGRERVQEALVLTCAARFSHRWHRTALRCMADGRELWWVASRDREGPLLCTRGKGAGEGEDAWWHAFPRPPW